MPILAAVVGSIEAALARVRRGTTAGATPTASTASTGAATALGRRVGAFTTATTASARRALRFDRRVDDVAVFAIGVEADAAEWTAWQSGSEPRPGVAAVD